MDTNLLRDELLTHNNGGQFISFEYFKVLKSNKDNKEKQAGVRISYKNVYLGGDYLKKVQTKLKKVGKPTDYELSQTWGNHENQVLVEWNGKEYMQAYIVANTETKKLGYEIDGRAATLAEIAEIVRPSELETKSSNVKKQETAGLNESEQVQVRKFALENVISININGKRF